MPLVNTARRRGVENASMAEPFARRWRSSRSLTRRRNSSRALSIMRAGISSVPISKRKSGMSGGGHQFFFNFFFKSAALLLLICPGDSDGKRANARDYADALGD